jgi:diaminopimelate epimerase
VREAGLTDKTEIRVRTSADVLTLNVLDDGQIRVNMAVPRFEPKEIPFIATKPQDVYDLALEDGDVEISALSLGNPHAVRVVKDVELAPVDAQGPMIERHWRFPERVNVGFMQVCDRDHIRLRVYERGVGETPACGSGACAAVVTGISRALLDDSVIVDMPGGRLRVEWSGNAQPVYMTGPAEYVFEGELKLSL